MVLEPFQINHVFIKNNVSESLGGRVARAVNVCILTAVTLRGLEISIVRSHCPILRPTRASVLPL